jgi:hypothetical protein
LSSGRGLARVGAVLAACILGCNLRAAPGIESQPFAPHPSPRGQTLFVRLSPDATGVRAENRYSDPRMWGDLYQEFSVGSMGTGVAIGDYDGDGRPDIYVVSKTEGCRLFRNLGGYRFEDTTERAGVGADPAVWTESATFADVNNDGRLDIYVCRFNAPNLLYLNQGDGTFRESARAYGLDVRDASVVAAFCDYDRDGRLDVYLATNLLNRAEHPRGQRGYLFHQNRDGTFTNVTDAAGIGTEVGQSHSATWFDYDGDGWPSLYVANDFGVPDKLYHNNRDGTFTDVATRALPHTSFSSMGADFGDLRNDGHVGFFVADMAMSTHVKDQRATADPRGREPEPPDRSPYLRKYPRNALFINTGTGRFLEAAFLAGVSATNWTWSVRLEDLDNDGRLDLFVTNGMNREQNNADLLGRIMMAESPMERIRIMHDSPVAIETHLAFRNAGDLDFEEVSAAWGLNQRGVGFGAALGDLSGDGNLDIVYTNYQEGPTVLRNDEDRGHRINIYLRGTASNRFGIGATIRVESALGVQVRQLQLARGYKSSSEPMAHFGLGADPTIRRLTISWPSGRIQSFENLPADRRYVVTEPGESPLRPATESAPPAAFVDVTASSGLGVAAREEVIDEVYQQRLIPLRLNRRGPAVAVGDVDGSGRDAVVVGGTTQDSLRLLRPATAGLFLSTPLPSTGTGADDGPILLFDSTGQGRQDLLVTKGGNTLPANSPDFQPRLFLNDGKGNFSPAPSDSLPPLPINAGSIAAADFEHNGRLGLFIGGRILPGRYPLAPYSALLANRSGRFEDVTDTAAPALREIGMVTSALWSDVDGDGWPDLLVALEWGPVKYFHNHEGKSFEDWSDRAGFSSAGSGWWFSLAGADLNGDGRIDYIVGNVGLNTQYRADRAHPALLFYGDFKGDGTAQIIEGYYEGDKLYPWRSRRDLGAVIPSVLKRFPRSDAYARATLGEILGEDRLEAARRFAATELRSGVFLSQPDGTFRFEPLPRIAQIAPFQGLVAGDFLGEGKVDVYGVQNSYAPIHLVSRFDGGLSQLLQGDGHGGLAPVAPLESGLVVPGDAKALAVIDLADDGWPGFVVTRNREPALAFQAARRAGRLPLKIRLHGPPGNPTGVGSRVSVDYTDGTTLTSEVYAGSGYYSQSSAATFFGYRAGNPPKTIHVRWPSGTVSHAAFSSGPVTVISAP